MRAWYIFQQGQCTNTHVLFWVISGNKDSLQVELEFFMFLLPLVTSGCFQAGSCKLGSKSPFSSSRSSKAGYCSASDNAEKWNGKRIRKLWVLWDMHMISSSVFLSRRHWKDSFTLSVAESIITAVQANSTRVERNTQESGLPFGLIFCLLCPLSGRQD